MSVDHDASSRWCLPNDRIGENALRFDQWRFRALLDLRQHAPDLLVEVLCGRVALRDADEQLQQELADEEERRRYWA